MARLLRRLNGLNDFEAAARLGSFSGAAEELHKTPAAISMQIKQLEKALGFRLFDRKARGVELTNEGRELAATISSAFVRIEEKVQSLARWGREHEVVLSSTHSLSMKWIAPRLPNLAVRHPGLDLRLRATDQILDVDRGECDIALRHSSSPSGELLFREWLVPVVAAASPFTDLTDALNSPILHEGDTSEWDSFLEGQQSGGIRADQLPARRYSHAALLVQAACAGSGVALAPFSIAFEDIAQGRLRLLPCKPMPASSDFYVVVRRGTQRPAVLDVLEWLHGEAQAMRLAFEDLVHEGIAQSG